MMLQAGTFAGQILWKHHRNAGVRPFSILICTQALVYAAACSLARLVKYSPGQARATSKALFSQPAAPTCPYGSYPPIILRCPPPGSTPSASVDICIVLDLLLHRPASSSSGILRLYSTFGISVSLPRVSLSWGISVDVVDCLSARSGQHSSLLFFQGPLRITVCSHQRPHGSASTILPFRDRFEV